MVHQIARTTITRSTRAAVQARNISSSRSVRAGHAETAHAGSDSANTNECESTRVSGRGSNDGRERTIVGFSILLLSLADTVACFDSVHDLYMAKHCHRYCSCIGSIQHPPCSSIKSNIPINRSRIQHLDRRQASPLLKDLGQCYTGSKDVDGEE